MILQYYLLRNYTRLTRWIICDYLCLQINYKALIFQINYKIYIQQMRNKSITFGKLIDNRCENKIFQMVN